MTSKPTPDRKHPYSDGYHPVHAGRTMIETLTQGLIFGIILTCMFSGVLAILACFASVLI